MSVDSTQKKIQVAIVSFFFFSNMKREPPELANSVLYKVQSTIMYQQQPPVKIVVAFDDIAGHKGCKSATNSERQYYYVLSTSPTSAVAEAVNTASRVVNINMKARACELPNFTPPSSKSTRTTASARFKSGFGRRPPCTFRALGLAHSAVRVGRQLFEGPQLVAVGRYRSSSSLLCVLSAFSFKNNSTASPMEKMASKQISIPQNSVL